jgi:hypothetical protein
MGMLVVQRTLSKGRLSGFLQAGCSLSDTLFSLIAVMDLFFIQFVEEKRFYFENAVVYLLFILD